MRARGESAEVTTTVHFRDYREVEGMLYPFRMETTAEGYGSPVPEEQRAKMEQRVEMMRQRMEQMERMLGHGPMTDTILVQEIRVNEGAP